jgi:ABC-type nitrate/sulfonate/bicarbonate transport system substrate-binding protein
MILFPKRRTLFSFVLLLLLFTTGCGATKQAAAPAANPAASKETAAVVEFKYPKNPSFDLVDIADKLGYWEGSGVRPNYVGAVASPQIVPAVSTGAIHFGSRHIPLAIAAIAGGADIKYVSAGTQTTPKYPHMKYFVRSDSNINDINDLVGKKIGINSFGACSEYVTKKYLRDNGLEDKVKFLVIANNQLEQSLKQGLVDAIIIHPPDSGRAEKSPELKRLWSDWDIDKGVSGMAGYSVNGKFLRENPEAVKKIVGILGKTANWVNANPDEARKIVAENLKIDVNLVEGYSYYQDQIVQDDAVQYWIDRLEAENKIEKGKWKIADFVSNEYNPFYKKKS